MTAEVDHQILTRLVSVERTLSSIEKRMFGNGQKGELTSLKERVRTLENLKMWLTGAMAGAAGAGVVIGYFIGLAHGG